MHSLYKKPRLTKPRYINGHLLSRIEHPGNCQAGAALRSYAAFSSVGADGYPGFASGRIQIPRGLILEVNNTHAEAEALPAALLAFEAARDNGPDNWIEIFSDRSCLIFQPETDPECAETFDMMRVFPVCLKLAYGVRIDTNGESYRLGLRDEDGHAWIAAITDDANKREYNLTGSNMPDHAREIICNQLSDEASAWLGLMDKMPFLADPGSGPLSGTLGVDIKAPRPELHGVEYAWPAALPYQGFTTDHAKACARFLELAWIYLLETSLKDVSDARIALVGGEPKQSGGATRLKISVDVIPASSKSRKATEKGTAQAFRDLLSSPEAPEGIESFTATACVPTNKSGTRTGVKGLVLYRHHLSQDGPASAHDRLRAIATFGR
jgi:hypothetical protein